MVWWFGRKSAPADARPFVPAWLTNVGEGEGIARSYSEQFCEVYQRNPVGQRAVRLVAGMLGGLTIDVVDGDSQAADLVQADGLLESIAASLLLHGNAYVQLIADGRDRPAELCLLRPERVSVVSDERGWPVAYLYRAGGRAVRIDRMDALERRQVAHVKGLHPRDDHRGLALAVFENLELVEFGNRIPFITAEIFGDETPPAVGSILNDAGGGLILCDEPRTIAGYAAHGPSIRAALEPLINTLDIQLLDDGVQLRTPSSNLLEIESEHDLGASAREPCPRLERSQVAGSQLPTTVRLSYYDPARDYQIGEARASTSDENRLDARLELPAAIDAEGAKALSQEQLARGWAERDRITVRLPTRYFALRPGMHLDLPIVPARWLVERSAIEDFACVLEARPHGEAIDPIGADSGRLLEHTPAYGETEIALFRAPACFGPSEEPTLLLAASSPGPGWRSEAVEVCVGPHRLIERTARRKSVLGRALNQLAPDGGYLEVELVDPDQWLVSCDDEALASGANFGLLGDELIQFSEAEPVGPGRFRLKGLVRGCRGTEWAEGSHEVRDSFVLVERGTLRPIAVPPWIKASKIAVTVYGGPGSRRLVR